MQASEAVELLQQHLEEETLVVADKQRVTEELIASIGQEKAKVDAEVEASRSDEEEAAALQREVEAFQTECAADLAAAEPIIKVRGGGLRGGEWCAVQMLAEQRGARRVGGMQPPRTHGCLPALSASCLPPPLPPSSAPGRRRRRRWRRWTSPA